MKCFLVILAAITGVLIMSGSAGAQANHAKAVFAGGCFWCMQPPFDKTTGVIKTTVGYTGGHLDNPTYHDVSAGGTGHLEAIEIEYDPQIVAYEKLLDIFWHNIDPLDSQGQFCDKGDSYKSAIFYLDDEQKKAAEESLAHVQKSLEEPVVTSIAAASTFYPAEDYHQSYYTKNTVRYKYYRYSCGRDKRLEELWGKK